VVFLEKEMSESPERDPIIMFRDVVKIYPLPAGDVVALDHVSISVEQADFIAIMGPSGSGKSTLLNLMGCLDTPTSGYLEIMGRDITIDKFGDYVIEQLNLHYPKARIQHYGDPACHQSNDKSELTSWKILASKGIRCITKQSTYRERKEIIEGRLSRLNGDKPSLLIDKRYCKICIDGFLGGYHYPEKREEQQLRVSLRCHSETDFMNIL